MWFRIALFMPTESALAGVRSGGSAKLTSSPKCARHSESTQRHQHMKRVQRMSDLASIRGLALRKTRACPISGQVSTGAPHRGWRVAVQLAGA